MTAIEPGLAERLAPLARVANANQGDSPAKRQQRLKVIEIAAILMSADAGEYPGTRQLEQEGVDPLGWLSETGWMHRAEVALEQLAASPS